MTSLLLPDINYTILDREFDRTKTQVFLGKNAAFLGPLMCSMNFSWTTDIETACTNGINLWQNPYFFLNSSPKLRRAVLKHELWHPGLMHMIRRGDRDPEIWNYAGDIVINNMLDDEGEEFEGFSPWMDHSYDGWLTEAVYDDLIEHKNKFENLLAKFGAFNWTNPISGLGDKTDIVEPTDQDAKKALEHTILNNVVSASHGAGIGGGCGDMPGEVETMLKRFLSPKLPWEQILRNFFNELSNQDFRWARPNRRYSDVYLPSLMDDNQGLDHIIYYLDVSGSISDGDIIRFHSEFKYVKEMFEPEKMTMVQFDTRIQKEDVFLKEDKFEETHIIGRGGTDLVCVREHIIENNPTAVVIFSDLCVTPMEPLPPGMNIPIIWVCLNNTGVTVPHGQIIHIRE
jgi:predicted metal-dependent peptidase